MPATALAVPAASQIQAWSTEHLESAATAWEHIAEAWEHSFTAVHREAPSPGGTPWTGAGADAAVLRTGTDRRVVVGAAESLYAAASEARYGAGEISGARELGNQRGNRIEKLLLRRSIVQGIEACSLDHCRADEIEPDLIQLNETTALSQHGAPAPRLGGLAVHRSRSGMMQTHFNNYGICVGRSGGGCKCR